MAESNFIDYISFLKGVEDLKVSLDQKTVTITYNPAKTDEATLQKALEKLGYSAQPDNRATASGVVSGREWPEVK